MHKSKTHIKSFAKKHANTHRRLKKANVAKPVESKQADQTKQNKQLNETNKDNNRKLKTTRK